MQDQRLVAVRMIRDNLEGIPQFPLPSPFTIRFYRPGDVETWIRIHEAAERFHEINRGLFEKQFGRNENALIERQVFLCDGEGTEIGTATAWYHRNYHGRYWGRVHWVAMDPAWQGRGLAKPLLTVVCNRLIELGHPRAYLTTETARLAAIRLYSKFGFVPDIQGPRDSAAWHDVKRTLGANFISTTTDASPVVDDAPGGRLPLTAENP